MKSHFGNPTVLINNAGCARGKSILDSSEKDIQLTFNVNAISHYYLAQQFLPAMIAKNHGSIVTVASMAGYVCAPNMVDYASSKAAALAFHEGLTAELATVYKAKRVRTVLMAQVCLFSSPPLFPFPFSSKFALPRDQRTYFPLLCQVYIMTH